MDYFDTIAGDKNHELSTSYYPGVTLLEILL